MNLVGRDAEQSGKASLRHRETLARCIDRERIAVPHGDNRVRLHRIVILRRGLVGRSDRLCRTGKLSLDVAAMRLRRKAGADGRRQEAFRRIETHPGRFDLVAWREQGCALGRGFERLCDDDRDRLAGIADLVVLQQIKPEHKRI